MNICQIISLAIKVISHSEHNFPFSLWSQCVCVFTHVYQLIIHIAHAWHKLKMQWETSLFNINFFSSIIFYLWSLLHQLQLKPIWEDTQGPQPLNWRHARKQERTMHRRIGSIGAKKTASSKYHHQSPQILRIKTFQHKLQLHKDTPESVWKWN